jgi:DNA polymerase III gamma/tau subunit
MVLKAGISDPALLGIPESLLPDLRAQAELFSKEDLLRLFDAFQKIEMGMKYATQVRFQLEMGLIELAQISRLRSLEDLIAEFAADQGADLSLSRTPQPDSGQYKSNSATAVPAAHSSGAPARTTALPEAPKQLLRQIAAAVGRESLQSWMQNLEGAALEGDKVVLELGGSNDFVRRQIKENLSAITEAAIKVVGRSVQVVTNSLPAPSSQNSSSTREVPESAPNEDLLEKVKREPVVKSFLDVFPGPVKAEKIDS